MTPVEAVSSTPLQAPSPAEGQPSDPSPREPWYHRIPWIAIGTSLAILVALAGVVWFIASEKEELKEEISINRTDIKVLDTNVQHVQGDVQDLQGDLKHLQGDVRALRDNVGRIEDKLDGVAGKLDRVLENPTRTGF